MKQIKYRFFAVVLISFLMIVGVAAAQTANFFCEADDAIGAMTAYQGKAYVLRYAGLFSYNGERMTLVSQAVSCDWRTKETYVDFLLADENNLYAYDAENRRLLLVLENGNPTKPREIVRVSGAGYPDTMFLQGSLLYLFENDGNQTLLTSVSLTDGTERQISTSSITNAASYRNGLALALERRRVDGRSMLYLSQLDLVTGKLRPITEVDSTISALAYDESNDCVYAAGLGKLYTWRQDTGITLGAYTLGGDTSAVVALADACAAVAVDNGIALRSIVSGTEQHALTLYQPYGRSEEYKAFLTANPGAALVFEGTEGISAEEKFTQAMAAQSAEIDIYLLTDPNLLSTINAKGYYVDLSANAAIANVTADMYQPFQNLFHQKNGIVAIPQSLFVTMLGCDATFFADFHLAIPTDVDALLTVTQLWLDEYACENDDALFDPFRNGVDLISLLARYADECIGNEQKITYATVEMEALVQKYVEVSRTNPSVQKVGSYERYAMNVIDVPHLGLYEYMPLSIISGNEPVISGTDVDLAYYVVNPFTAQPKAALAFLESVVTGWTPAAKLLLLSSAAHAVEREDYANESTALRAELEILHDAAESCADNPMRAEELNQQIQSKLAAQEACEKNRWSVT
ncbi:MAG: hypothetical protein RSE23_03310, partial [Clostridia bacterium]